MATGETITELLAAWEGGSAEALDQLIPKVHEDLRRLARARFAAEAAGHTLEPTAVVHETYLRLVDQKRVHWKSRAQFFAIAARLMRRVLIDHARRKHAAKREAVTLPEPPELGARPVEVLDLDAALVELEALDPRQAEIVELRYFAGMTVRETAAALGVSPSTVKADWRMARAWLARRLGDESV